MTPSRRLPRPRPCHDALPRTAGSQCLNLPRRLGARPFKARRRRLIVSHSRSSPTQRPQPYADGGVKVKSGGKVTVFDVGGNNYRLIVTIAYKAQAVTVLEVMTHAEYSKHLWKARY